MNSLTKTNRLSEMRKEHEDKINSLIFIKEYTAKIKIYGALDIVKQCDDFKELDKEVFVVFYLDTKNIVIKREIISMGILDASIIHPREVFRSACLFGASRIILSHNHPSGDPTPSEEDLSITKKLIDCGELLGIEVLDHIIVDKENKYWSYVTGDVEECI